MEFTRTGRVVRQRDIRGKCDGVTADPARHRVIATVNAGRSAGRPRRPPPYLGGPSIV